MIWSLNKYTFTSRSAILLDFLSPPFYDLLMKISDLEYSLPEDRVATEPLRPSRVLWVQGEDQVKEISLTELIHLIPPNDVLVINNTQVLKRRVFSIDTHRPLEILFIQSTSESTTAERPTSDLLTWEVLFPAREIKLNESIELPGGVFVKLIKKGRPQIVKSNIPLTDDYFQKVGELPLPPYIQKKRGSRHEEPEDEKWYQTAWAQIPGSLAAPTASLHFSQEDLQDLSRKQVHILSITLHVGLGTFLPIQVEDLDEHPMHSEYVEIPPKVWAQILDSKKQGVQIWALGSTVLRALESQALGILPLEHKGGSTSLLIQPGFSFQVADYLLTNFHQPRSTLLALVAAFSGLTTVKKAYLWALEKEFRFLSYGDLSVWRCKK